MAMGARLAFLFVVVVTAALVGMRGAPVGRAQPAGIDIAIFETDDPEPDLWGYQPNAVTVSVGDTVTWTNTGASFHSATADDGSFDSGLLRGGATFSLTVTDVGTFAYHCMVHPWMKGVLTVAPPAE